VIDNKKPFQSFAGNYLKARMSITHSDSTSRGYEVVDYTSSIYKKSTPASVEQAKRAVLGALDRQAAMVKSVVFLENFNVSKLETAISGELRCAGLAVTLDSQYQLSSEDSVWLNGLYGECASIYPLSCASEATKLQRVSKQMFEPKDSRMVAGMYEKPGVDKLTGQSRTDRFCIVNASAAHLGRNIVDGWTSAGVTLRDAYESAATKTLTAAEGSQYDNLGSFTSAVNAQLAAQFGALEPSATQISNTFIRGTAGSVVYLNGAVANSEGVLCHVSPLHGFVKFPPSESRLFYPANLLSHSYLDVTALTEKQRVSIFKRAKWAADTTVNPFALRKPIQQWQAALPQPVEVYRMDCGYFGCDEREAAALPTKAILQMTPTAEHVRETPDAEHKYPQHVREDRVRLVANDVSVAKLVAMRDRFKVLDPNIYDGKFLNLPRELAETLI